MTEFEMLRVATYVMCRALMLQVMLKGLTVKHCGGSPTMTLSTGVGSVCINIKEEGPPAILALPCPGDRWAMRCPIAAP